MSESILISRESFRATVLPHISEIGFAKEGKEIDDPIFGFAMGINNLSVAKDIEDLLFGKKEG